MPNETIIIDYGMGNLFSIYKKLRNNNVQALITSDYRDVIDAKKIILPGVGHFSKAIENIHKLSLWEVLNEAILVKKTPILGICLGMQLMTKHSEEGNDDGFGWFDADVKRFHVSDPIKYKIPHMGWNQIMIKKQNALFDGIVKNSEFYFIHSYYIQSTNQDEILTTTRYEDEFVSGLQKENIFGLQFHPEKSHDSGEKVLLNFLRQ